MTVSAFKRFVRSETLSWNVENMDGGGRKLNVRGDNESEKYD